MTNYIIGSHQSIIKVLYMDNEDAKDVLGNYYSPELVNIIKENSSYISDHNLYTRDLEIIERMRKAIEGRNLNSKKFSLLDNVEYINEYGKEYPRAVIDGDTYRNGTTVLCESGGVHVSLYKDDVCHSISGGSFPTINPDNLIAKGTVQRTFWTWGSCGACGNGGLYFKATVKNWELDERI